MSKLFDYPYILSPRSQETHPACKIIILTQLLHCRHLTVQLLNLMS